MSFGPRRLRALVVESRAFRRFAKSALGRAALDSSVRRSLNAASRQLAIDRSRRRDPDLFGSVKTCFLMIGHTKSGGSLLGGMLDAHPQVVCADELGLARILFETGDADAGFRLALRNARREYDRGRVTSRRVDPYSLRIPGSHQGTTDGAVVAVGDSRGGPTTRYLADLPSRIERIRDVLDPIDMRFVHVVRNPFDPIAFMVVRGGRSVGDAIADYAGQCERVSMLADGQTAVRMIRYEDLVSRPGATVSGICDFLRIPIEEAHVKGCEELVRPVRPERHRIDWSPADILAVEALIKRFDFLRGYSLEVQP